MQHLKIFKPWKTSKSSRLYAIIILKKIGQIQISFPRYSHPYEITSDYSAGAGEISFSAFLSTFISHARGAKIVVHPLAVYDRRSAAAVFFACT